MDPEAQLALAAGQFLLHEPIRIVVYGGLGHDW
jgi:hypothetical protein